MLNNLKNALRQERETEAITESMTRSNRGEEYIKSAFLDGLENATLGAENDPEIKGLIESIPEYDDYDESVESEINAHALAESLTETEI